MKTKYALVLSGGGFRGAFQVGALQYLQDNWQKITGNSSPMKFDIVAGVSTGSLNGAMVSMDKFITLQRLWQKLGENGASEIYTSEFIDTASSSDSLHFKLDIAALAKRLNLRVNVNLSLFQKIGLIFSKDRRSELFQDLLNKASDALKENYRNFRSFASNKPLADKLYQHMDRSRIKGTRFAAGFVSLDSGKYYSVCHDEFATNDDFIKGVLSSTSMPVVWEPVDKVTFRQGDEIVQATNNVDGGVMNVSPLGDVISLIEQDQEECNYRIVIINCSCGVPKADNFSQKSVGAIAMRSCYELTLSEIFNNDIGQFMQINELAKQSKEGGVILNDETGRPIKCFDTMVISPDENFDLGDPLAANVRLISERMQHGADQAAKSPFFK